MNAYFFSVIPTPITMKYDLSDKRANSCPRKTLCQKYGVTLLRQKGTHFEIINCWFSSQETHEITLDLSLYSDKEELCVSQNYILIFPQDAQIRDLQIATVSSLESISFLQPDTFSINLFDTNNIVYGVPDWNQNKSFEKYNSVTEEEFQTLSESAQKEFTNLSANTSGCYLEFMTSSPLIHITGKLKRGREYLKIPFLASHGFDVYESTSHGKDFLHRDCFCPDIDSDIINFEFLHNPDSVVRIYLPLYNSVQTLFIESLSEILPTTASKKTAVFYGNSITQGASASRSGMAFPNIVSRRKNWEVINFSLSSCCKAFTSIAKEISKMGADYIFIDYSRNAWSDESLSATLTSFYKIIRDTNPDTPIILLTTACFNSEQLYNNYDNIIKKLYCDACDRNEPVYLIDQTALFSHNEYAICCVDGEHYTDYGMKKVAQAILELPLP